MTSEQQKDTTKSTKMIRIPGSFLFQIVCLITLLVFSSCNNHSTVPETPVPVEPPGIDYIESLPFKKATDGYNTYRIPAMVVSEGGTVLAFAEGRVNSREDQGNIDIVLKRSTDNGETWSDLIVVIDHGDNRAGNPVPIVIPSTGRILLIYSWNFGHCCNDRKISMTYSDDDGKTWSKERQITSMVKTADMDGVWYATGPVHGIVKQRGEHVGRVIVPTNFGRNENSRSMVIYSDDNGESWHMGAKSPVPSSESTVVELSNGDLMLNMRNPKGSAERNRIVAASKDGGLTFSSVFYDEQLTEPRCQASILFHSINPVTKKGNILFSNPPGTNSRQNSTLKLSEDDGEVWSKQLQYVPDGTYGGYSDMAILDNGKIALLHELGYLNSVGIAFQKVDLSNLE